MNFGVLVHKDEHGGYWAEVPELPGCLSQGETLEETESNIKEALELMLEGLVDDYAASLQAPNEGPGGKPSLTWEIPVNFGKAKSKAKASA